MQTFGPWLKQARKAAGLTQQDLADAARIDNTTVSHIEADRITGISEPTLLAFAELLQLDRDETLLRAGKLPFWFKGAVLQLTPEQYREVAALVRRLMPRE